MHKLNRQHCSNKSATLQVEPRVGGKFSIYGGAVDATFTALEAPLQIGMDWRFKSWPDGCVSKVCCFCSDVSQCRQGFPAAI
jgi:activator of HSP90 ATPase